MADKGGGILRVFFPEEFIFSGVPCRCGDAGVRRAQVFSDLRPLARYHGTAGGKGNVDKKR